MREDIKEAWESLKDRLYVSALEMHNIAPKYYNTSTEKSLVDFTIDNLEEVKLIEKHLEEIK